MKWSYSRPPRGGSFSRRPGPAGPAARKAVLETLEPRRHLHAGHQGTFINAGGVAYVDAAGHAWQADAAFVGGDVKRAVYDVAGTTDDPVYAPRRFGTTFSYDVPVAAAGTYRVTLLFAEAWFTRAGQRVFNVSAEGTIRLPNFDILAAGAPKAAVSRSFDVAVTDGTLNVGFAGVVENAMVSGVIVERAAQVPPAPSALAATAASATRIDLRWADTSSEETGFAIERSTDGANFTRIAVVNGNLTSFSNSDVTPGVGYWYRVRATSAAGASAPSNVVTARTAASPTVQSPFGGAPIRLPATLQAENFDNGGANVAFADVTPGNLGGVYRDTPVDVFPVSSTTGTLTALSTTPPAPPQYGVGSIRPGEWLEYTIETPQAMSVNLTLRFASGSQGGTGSLWLNGVRWGAATVNLPNTTGWTRFQPLTVQGGTIPAGRHVIRLQFDRATRAGEELGVLDWLRFNPVSIGGGTGGTAPAAPANFFARGVGDTQVNLSWDDVATNETGYLVQRRLQAEPSYTTVATLPAGSEWFVDSGVRANTAYAYRVVASGTGGLTAASREVPLSTWVADTFRWKAGPATFARYEAAGAAANGKLYVFGGYINSRIQATARVDAYDPATDRWTQLPDMPEVVTHAGQAVDGNVIYLAGGFVGDHPGLGTRSVWRFDTTNNRWSRMTDLPAPRGAGALVRQGRNLHFFGGLVRAQFVTQNQAEHWVLNLDSPGSGWKARAPLPNARNHLAGVELNGKVYAVGGQDVWNEVTGAMTNVDVYDPATNTWAAAAPLPKPRGHISASTFAVGGRIYVVGGSTNNLVAMRDVTVYNPATNAWSPARELLGARLTPVAGAIGKLLVVSTGSAYGLLPQGETWFGLLD